MMTSKASLYITVGTVIGLIAGAFVGYFAPGFSSATAFIGELFLAALRLVVLPLIVVSVVLGIGSLMTRQRVGRTLGTTLVYFAATTAVAIVIGLVVVNVVGPGNGVDSSGLAAPEAVRQARVVSTGDIVSTLFPGNPLVVLTGGRYFALIFFSLLLGAVLAVMGPRRRPVLDFFRSFSDAIMIMVQWVMYAAPIGLFFLIAATAARSGVNPGDEFLRMGAFLLCLAIGLLIHAVVVLPLALKLWGNRPVGEYFVKLLPAFGTVMATNSPTATLPATFHGVVGDLRVDNRAASAVLPLGATMNLNATAMWTVMGAFFAAQSIGLSLGFGQVLVILGGALVASFVTAGVPGAGLLIIAVVFDLAGMPEAAFGALALIAATDWLTERVRNAADVWSDAVGASVVAGRLTRSSRSKPDRPKGRKPDDKSKQDQRSRQDKPTRRSAPDDRRSARRSDRDSRDRGSRKPERPDKERTGRPDRRGSSDRRQRDSRTSDRADRRRQPRRRDDQRESRREARHEEQQGKGPFDLKQDNIVDLEATPERMADEVIDSRKTTSDSRPTGGDTKRTDRAPSKQTSEDRNRSPRASEPHHSRQTLPHVARGQHSPATESKQPPPSSHRDDRSVPESVELGPDLMERERARLQGQMKQLDEKQDVEDREDRPQIDFSTEDWDKDQDKDRPRKAESQREEPQAAEKEAEPAAQETPSGPIEYGRTKHRRGWGVKSGSEQEPGEPGNNSEERIDKGEDEDLKTVPDSFSIEEQSFGRTKKRRSR